MADSDSSEEVSIHSLADVPVLRYADPRDPNAIYTFLGLATLPRLRPGNPLRLLPREMVLKIARFAHGYRAGWEGVGRSGQLADAVDHLGRARKDSTPRGALVRHLLAPIRFRAGALYAP